MAGAPGTIPWRDVRDWCQDYGITGMDRELMEAAVRTLDECFLASWFARQAAA